MKLAADGKSGAFLHEFGGFALRGTDWMNLLASTFEHAPNLDAKQSSPDDGTGGYAGEMTMSHHEIEAWATAYIEWQRTRVSPNTQDTLWWAVENFMFPGNESVTPEDCWAAILAVLARDPPADVKGILAAGPLEDLIHYRGPEFIDRIEEESRRNPSFRRLLGGVWQSSTPEVWARVQKARSSS